MAKTIARPTAVTGKPYTLALGFFVFFKQTSTSPNIIDGLRIRDFTKDAITADLIDVSDQMSMDAFKAEVTGAVDAGTLSVRVYYNPQKPMPDIYDQLHTFNTGVYGKVTLAVNNEAAPTGPLNVVMDCDAVLQSYGDIPGTYGEVLYTNFVFKLTGKPSYYDFTTTP